MLPEPAGSSRRCWMSELGCISGSLISKLDFLDLLVNWKQDFGDLTLARLPSVVHNIWCAANAHGAAGSEAPADACELPRRGLGRFHKQRGWSSASLRDFVPSVKLAQSFTSGILAAAGI